MPPDPVPPPKPRRDFRTTVVRVLIVQAVALAILGLIQLVYNLPGR